MTEPSVREVIVPAAHGAAIEVRAGEYLAIIDLGRITPLELVASASPDPGV